ncbi:MAG: hypothetical protein H6644_03620 [Caldilineaceae bacterium]|nr:hypothetical protein [Caldilineaceae bacterium]
MQLRQLRKRRLALQTRILDESPHPRRRSRQLLERITRRTLHGKPCVRLRCVAMILELLSANTLTSYWLTSAEAAMYGAASALVVAARNDRIWTRRVALTESTSTASRRLQAVQDAR